MFICTPETTPRIESLKMSMSTVAMAPRAEKMMTGLLSVTWLTMNIDAMQKIATFTAWKMPCSGRFIVRSLTPLKCSTTSRIEQAMANDSSVYQMFATLEQRS